MKQHLAEIAFREPVRRLRRNQAAFDRALLHARVVDAAPVIFDFNINVIAAMVRAQGYLARFRFSGSNSVFGTFDPVRHRVADQVYQGV